MHVIYVYPDISSISKSLALKYSPSSTILYCTFFTSTFLPLLFATLEILFFVVFVSETLRMCHSICTVSFKNFFHYIANCLVLFTLGIVRANER